MWVSVALLVFWGWFGVGRADPLVHTLYGPISGRTNTLHTGQKVNSFYGIPYAKPPLGERRWKHPEKPEPWGEIFHATKLPSACPQDAPGILVMTHPYWNDYSEDCLTINIFAPNDTSGVPYPVMVWLHGGGYAGSANIQYPGHFLAGKDVVVAVPNYRLGNLGFMSTEDDVVPGNYGSFDQILALEFVRDNIAAFGGDPNKVTLFGQSAGGSSIGLLTVSPRATGLFHQVIHESGTDEAVWGTNYPNQHPANYAHAIAEQLGCPTYDSNALVECMRKVPYDDVRKATFACTPGHFCQGVAPVVDGPGGFLPDVPWELRERGEFQKLPMMNGHCKDDGSAYTVILVPEANNGGFNRTHFLHVLRHKLVSIFAPSFPEHAEDMFEALNFYYTPWPHIDDEELNRDKINELITDFGFGMTGDATMKVHSRYADVYFYVLGYRSKKAAPVVPEWMGVTHNGELPYVLGLPFLQKNPKIRLDSGIVIDIIRWDEEDIEWAEYITTMWTNFAKYGNPTPEPVPSPGGNPPTTWRKFSEADQQYLYMDRTVENLKDYRQRNFALWLYYIFYLIGRREGENPPPMEEGASQVFEHPGMSSDQIEKGFNHFYNEIVRQHMQNS